VRSTSPRACALALLVGFLVAVPPPPASALTEDQIIDQVMTLGAIRDADDLVEELRELAAAFAADPEDHGGFGVNLTSVLTQPLHFRGTTVSTMSMCLPLLEGDAQNPATPRGRLAQRIRKHVSDYLLNRSYWEWEHATRTGAPYLSSPNPEITFAWGSSAAPDRWPT